MKTFHFKLAIACTAMLSGLANADQWVAFDLRDHTAADYKVHIAQSQQVVEYAITIWFHQQPDGQWSVEAQQRVIGKIVANNIKIVDSPVAWILQDARGGGPEDTSPLTEAARIGFNAYLLNHPYKSNNPSAEVTLPHPLMKGGLLTVTKERCRSAGRLGYIVKANDAAESTSLIGCIDRTINLPLSIRTVTAAGATQYQMLDYISKTSKVVEPIEQEDGDLFEGMSDEELLDIWDGAGDSGKN